MRTLVSTALVLLAAAPLWAAESLDDVVAKHIDARGGMEKLKSVDSMKISGTMSMPGGMEAPFVIFNRRPNRFRMEMTIQSQTMIQAFDGETAWMVVPFMGSTDPQKAPPEEQKNMKESADIDGPLVDWKDKGHQLALSGTEDLDGSPTYRLELKMKSGREQTIFLDPDAYIELKSITKREIQGTETELETEYGDYKDVEGLLIPHFVETRANGQTMMKMVIDTVELNVPVEDDLFLMPEAEEKPEAEPAS